MEVGLHCLNYVISMQFSVPRIVFAAEYKVVMYTSCFQVVMVLLLRCQFMLL